MARGRVTGRWDSMAEIDAVRVGKDYYVRTPVDSIPKPQREAADKDAFHQSNKKEGGSAVALVFTLAGGAIAISSAVSASKAPTFGNAGGMALGAVMAVGGVIALTTL